MFDEIDDISGIDFVFSSNVLEHIKDDIEVLKAIRNKLSDNGELYLYLPAHMILMSRIDEVVGHYRRYSKKISCLNLNFQALMLQEYIMLIHWDFFASLVVKVLVIMQLMD